MYDNYIEGVPYSSDGRAAGTTDGRWFETSYGNKKEQPINYTTVKKKSIIAIAVAVLVCLPCILIIDGHVDVNGEEHLGWTNLIGTAWFAFLALGGFKAITPKWMRDELEAYMPEHD